jgi:homoserine O-acetyltransferase
MLPDLDRTLLVHAPDPRTPRRLVAELPSLTIDERAVTDVTLAGYAYGPALGTAPVVVVVGGITASPLPFGEASAPDDGSTTAASGWWSALADPELVDLERTTVLCPAWPGSGSTWSGFGAAPGGLSVLGLADLIAAWLDAIGCRVPVTFVGASLGGLVALVFAARHPAQCSKVVTISAGLRPDGWGTAVRHLQRELVRDGIRRGDPESGMSHARQLGMLTYRSRDEFDLRFGKLSPQLERPPVADYLDHHGQRFARQFPPETFLLLSEAIDRCHLGADEAEVARALARIRAEVVIVGVPSDMLFPWSLQLELHRALETAGVRASLWRLDSAFGHDAFLADQRKLADVLRAARAFEHAAPASAARLRDARAVA